MEVDLKGIKQRFFTLNRDRLRRVQDALRWKQRDFLDLLPLLFHINHPMLPGFVSQESPAGVALYTPPKAAIDAAKRIAKSLDYRRRALRTFDIHAIFLMGSVGTIAHSDKSDFDVWVCYRPDMSGTELNLLGIKCRAIEEWAQTLGLEVHFFLMDADKFRTGEVHELSSESSGSTQHHLLLEEFYRTGLLVAGRYPAWWLVPPEHEPHYDEYIHELTRKRFIPANECVDFGGLGTVPAEEYFGAALWQVYKGIDSPFKSVLKILLMECYASEYPRNKLLSLQFKQAVYDGVIDLNELDPYIMLYRKLESYLSERGELDRLDLVRRCFYIKIDLRLSQKVQKEDWQRELLWSLVTNWRWSEGQLATLDARANWKIHRVLNERKILVEELTHSYLFLSNFARAHSGFSRLEQKDLNILGRKLYAAFERKAGKVDLINRGISTNIEEPRLVIHQSRKQNEEAWSLHVDTDVQEGRDEGLKRSRSLLELLCWVHFNRLLNPGTLLSLDIKDAGTDSKDVRSVLGVLQSDYPHGKLPGTSIEDFSKPPCIVAGAVFVNIGADALPMHTRRGTDLVSAKADVLNYSGFSFNLAHAIDMLIITSWQEVLTYRFSGVEGLLDCLCQYLRWHTESDALAPVPLGAHCFSAAHGNSIARRMQQLFTDVADYFYYDAKLQSGRYVLEIEQTYYLLYTESGALVYKKAPRIADMLELLAKPTAEFCPLRADRQALQDSCLPLLMRKNEPGIIQVFFQKFNDNEASIYVLDERGALFHQRAPYFDDNALLNQYSLFLDSVLNRQSFLLQDSAADELRDAIDFYKVADVKGKHVLQRQHVNPVKLDRRYINVQVIGDVVDQQTVFTVYCDEKEFSSYDHGKNVFSEVARHVLSKRASGLRYPIYITDIDLSPSLLGSGASGRVQAIDFLNYKKRIEEKLNQELAAL